MSRPAERDLDDIWTFTDRRWGEEQADHYVAELRSAAMGLTIDPLRGGALDEPASHLRRVRVAKHFIFYRVSASEIFVVRFLHERMDILHHLL